MIYYIIERDGNHNNVHKIITSLNNADNLHKATWEQIIHIIPINVQ